MPKHRNHSYSSASNRSRGSSPYSRSSKHTDDRRSKTTFPLVGSEKEWEGTKCPICLEHPHNAVLLLCSSHEKGCRRYMCDTSNRHSNCLDQFRKLTSPATQVQKTNLQEVSSLRNFKKLEKKLPCPLCRGQISGWMVVETARSYMNLKKRICSLERCDFSGTYSELRRHARDKHPSLCPRETDPQRVEEWTRLENERTHQDLLAWSDFTTSNSESAEDTNPPENTYRRGYSPPSDWGSWDFFIR